MTDVAKPILPSPEKPGGKVLNPTRPRGRCVAVLITEGAPGPSENADRLNVDTGAPLTEHVAQTVFVLNATVLYQNVLSTKDFAVCLSTGVS